VGILVQRANHLIIAGLEKAEAETPRAAEGIKG